MQVLDTTSVNKAIAGAWPRQALALTIAHWQLATECTPVITPLTSPPTFPSISPEASSLLHLAHLTSKAFAIVHQPLPSQAMAAWQHATWPVGSCELLSMGMTAAADAPLQAFIAECNDPAAAATVGTSQRPESQAAPLQQSVIAASNLLSTLAQAQKQWQAAFVEADAADQRRSPDFSPARSQSAKLPSGVVGAIATRGYQLSSGNANAALAILVAAALPEWADRTQRAVRDGHSPPSAHLGPVANGRAGPSGRRKRERSMSR